MNTVETPETVSGTVIPGTSDLSAHVIRPEIASYANNLYAANTMFAMKLSDRLGETAYSDAIKAAGKKAGSFWIRTAGGHTRNVMADGENTTRGNWGLVQLGGDLISWPTSGTHRMHVGLMAGYAHESNKTGSDTADYSSKGKVSGFSGGLYATWMNSNATGDGPYVDAWLQYQRFKNTTSVGNYAEEESYHSKGFTGSLEAGYTFALKDWQNGAVSNATRLRLEGQVIRMGVRADNENLDRNRKYREEQLEYQKQLSAYQVEWDRKNSRTKEIETEYSDWILNQTEAVRNLKIVIPHELQPTYDYLAALGKA